MQSKLEKDFVESIFGHRKSINVWVLVVFDIQVLVKFCHRKVFVFSHFEISLVDGLLEFQNRQLVLSQLRLKVWIEDHVE